MGGLTQFEREIREQPDVLARQLERGRPVAEAIADAIARKAPKFAVMVARGSSDNAARYAQYLFGMTIGEHAGMSVALATPSVITLYGGRPSFRDALVVGISQSGQSPDVVAVLAEARAQGALVVAVTNDPASPLAGAADHVVELHAGPEVAVAASKTYTSSLLALAMLRTALAGGAEGWQDLAEIPEHVARALERAGDLRPRARAFDDARGFVVLGRGLSYATAFELALKLGETTHALALPFSSADFRHGPIAMAQADLPTVVIASSDPAGDDVAALVLDLQARRSPIVAISDREDVLAHADVAIALPSGVPSWLSPIVSIIPGQLWALALALEAGLDPDHPRGLAKITRTR